jgi:hypothetical protein
MGSTWATVEDWIDRRVVDHRGDVVGVVVDVYADAHSGASRWLAISNGYFGTRVRVAPLHGASHSGGDVVVAYHRSIVEAAPPVHAVSAISHGDEQLLRAYYQLPTDPLDTNQDQETRT